MRALRRRRLLTNVALGLAALLLLLGLALTFLIRGSLPVLSGEVVLQGLAGPVTIGCGDMLLGPALDVVAQQALPTARANAAIVRSTLSEPGLLGAAALVLEPHT